MRRVTGAAWELARGAEHSTSTSAAKQRRYVKTEEGEVGELSVDSEMTGLEVEALRLCAVVCMSSVMMKKRWI